MAESDQDNTEVDANATTTTETTDPYKDVLSQITNPEGSQKYKNALTALESIKPKDDMIVKLQEEIAEAKLKTLEMEDELSKRDSTQELVKKVMENRQQQQNTDTPSGEDAEKKIDIGELVRKEMAASRAEDSKAANRQTVASQLAETYGAKANDVLAGKMVELNVTPEFFTSVIEQSPAAALELLGMKAKAKAAPVKPQGSVRAESFSETTSDKLPSVMLADTAEINASWEAHMKEVLAS